MAHKPIEMIVPNNPKALRKRAEHEAIQGDTKRIARRENPKWRFKNLTREDAKIMGAHMIDWFIANPDADNLLDYFIGREQYSLRQIYAMRDSEPEFKDCLDLIYALFAARAQKGWKEADARRYYARMFEIFSPEHREFLKETKAITADTNTPTNINFITSYPNG